MKGLVEQTLKGVTGYRIQACSSTMDIAWELYSQKRFPEFAWVLAEKQTMGRGQMGKPWISPRGNLSVSMRIPGPAQSLGGLLSQAMALPLVLALEQSGLPARIKWPNDIMIDDCKVGGILIETKQAGIMAGIGMNLFMVPESLDIKKIFPVKAGSLHESGINMEAFGLWSLFLEYILREFPAMIADPAQTARRINAVLAWKDDVVVLQHNGKAGEPVRILGIDPQGRLIIQTAAGVSHIISGRIVPRVA